MSDWQKGDLALCIRGNIWTRKKTGEVHNNGPKTGDIFRVIDFTAAGHLCFAEFVPPPDARKWGFAPSRFRKIRPSAIKHIEALKDVPLPVRENEHA